MGQAFASFMQLKQFPTNFPATNGPSMFLFGMTSGDRQVLKTDRLSSDALMQCRIEQDFITDWWCHQDIFSFVENKNPIVGQRIFYFKSKRDCFQCWQTWHVLFLSSVKPGAGAGAGGD